MAHFYFVVLVCVIVNNTFKCLSVLMNFYFEVSLYWKLMWYLQPLSILNILTTIFCRILKHYGCLNLHIAKTVGVKGNRTTSVLFVINAILMMTLILKWCTVSIVTTGSMPSVKASLWISMSACGICQKRYNSFVDSAVRIS